MPLLLVLLLVLLHLLLLLLLLHMLLELQDTQLLNNFNPLQFYFLLSFLFFF